MTRLSIMITLIIFENIKGKAIIYFPYNLKTKLMALFGLFKKTDQEKLNYIRILFELAEIDGEFSAEELETISHQAIRLGLKQKDVAKIQSEIGTDFNIPSDPKLKESLIKDLVFMMLSDNHIAEKEYIFCKTIFSKLGLSKDALDKEIDAFLTMFINSRDLDPIVGMVLRHQHLSLMDQNG